MEKGRGVRMLEVLELLEQRSSQAQPLSMHNLLVALEQRGISGTRKSVGRDMTALRRFGYDVVFTRTPAVGYYLAVRPLNTAEVRMLLDAVAAAPFLTETMTRRLTGALQNLLDSSDRETARRQIYYDPVRKLDNEEIGCTVSVLQRAIALRKKVSLCYHHRILQDGHAAADEGRNFMISPYALFWRDDHYYLAGNYEKYDTVGNYRLDRMSGVQMLEETARSFSEITDYQDYFDTADYLRHEFYQFGGQEEQLLLRCENSFLDVLADRFGSELEVLECADTHFTAHVLVRVSEGLYEWLLQCGERVMVLSPTSVRDEMRNRLQTLCSAYRVQAKKQPPEEDG